MSLSQKFLIHLEYGKERKKIIEATKKLANVNKVVFTNFNTFKTENYNLIPIFSDEVFDLVRNYSIDPGGKWLRWVIHFPLFKYVKP